MSVITKKEPFGSEDITEQSEKRSMISTCNLILLPRTDKIFYKFIVHIISPARLPMHAAAGRTVGPNQPIEPAAAKQWTAANTLPSVHLKF